MSKIQEQTLTGKLLSIQEGKKEGQTDATDDQLQENEVQHVRILNLKSISFCNNLLKKESNNKYY